ncbi:MAG: hypothetical protein U0164_20705 [Gemmatimonadaceae bacterium]
MQRCTCSFLTIVLPALLACGTSTPATLVPASDPFVYNGPAPLPIPVKARDASGRALEVAIEATSDAPDIVQVKEQRMRCLRAGDARITASAGRARTTFVVQCRPIASFAPPLQSLDVVLGGEPVPLAPVAFDSGGQPVGALRFSAYSEDTSIATVAGGRVVPRGMGTTTVHMDFGGVAGVSWIEVVAPVVRDTVRLAAGEYRRWALGPGRYVATMSEGAGEAGGGGAPSVAWRTANANCVSDARSRVTLHCVLDDSGAVVAVAQRAASVAIRIDRRAR